MFQMNNLPPVSPLSTRLRAASLAKVTSRDLHCLVLSFVNAMKSSTVVFVALLVIVSLVLSTEAVITYRQCKSHDITTGCIFKTFSCTGNYAPSDGAYFTSPVVCCRCNQPGACYGCTSLSCSGSRNTCGAGPSVGGEDVPVIVKKSIGLST